MTKKILVIDDDAAIRMVIVETLKRDRYDVREAATIAEAREMLGRSMPDLLVTDVVLPDGNGLDLLPVVLAKRPELPVIVVSAQNTLTTAIRATERGAFEYLPKPFDLDELRRAVREGLARDAGGVEAAADDELPLIGRSPAMQDVYRVVARIAPTDLTVLILGESGTGKELVARALHDFGARRGKAFVAINMAAVPRDAIEAELFGQERAGFAGGTRFPGRFEQAAGGTLFLDEIGDMPLEAQTRLLRVLETGEYSSAGGRLRKVDVRVIAATHQDLPRAIAEGRFREDLYYRLNVVPLALPPLRAREGDVTLLAQHFLDRASDGGSPRKTLEDAAGKRLGEHDWPGNVRELENLMRRLAAVTRDRTITADDIEAQLAIRSTEGEIAAPSLEGRVEAWLRDHFRRSGDMLPPPGLYERLLAEVDAAVLRTTLAAVRGNQLRAAAILGINRNTLRKRLTELGIAPKG
ncbi:DNA-binding transcriptional regulator NtrC [Sphingomonas antarctica]|uniref:sigma 54-interacting transcriptional regulator n=1 Tax=Sphingomonas antarctica TaxID=2040274 RepID=UPI0039E7A3D4